jgi:hypothetical protein
VESEGWAHNDSDANKYSVRNKPKTMHITFWERIYLCYLCLKSL